MIEHGGMMAAAVLCAITLSNWKPFNAILNAGVVADGDEAFDIDFVVGVDGRITDVIAAEPGKRALGEYVATRMIGVQAAKPPEANWVIHFLYEGKKGSS